MSSREVILNSIKKNQKQIAALSISKKSTFSEIKKKFYPSSKKPSLKIFLKNLTRTYIQVEEIKTFKNLIKTLAKFKIDQGKIINQSKQIKSIFKLKSITNKKEIAHIKWGVVDGELGVEENGAIWVDLEKLNHPAFPFLVENLIIILDKKKLVKNMHQAYSHPKVKKIGNGVFIAGPSKTGDIEHNLVIGAHGPKSLLVVIK